MDSADPREALATLVKQRGDDYASLSRLLGRNAAYIQQFIRRGTPKKLDEDDRRTLARYFDVPESLLGGREEQNPAPKFVEVSRLAVGASAGPGALTDGEHARGRFGFEAEWLRAQGASRPDAVSFIHVAGDSMAPTLSDGDDILVDTGEAARRLRDGIYVLRMEDALLVKRLALNPATRRLTITSDNPAYPSWSDCDPATVEVIGRVIWAGRRVG